MTGRTILSFNYTRSESQSEKRSLSYYSLERRSDWSLLIRKVWDKNSQYASLYQQISIQILWQACGWAWTKYWRQWRRH